MCMYRDPRSLTLHLVQNSPLDLCSLLWWATPSVWIDFLSICSHAHTALLLCTAAARALSVAWSLPLMLKEMVCKLCMHLTPASWCGVCLRPNPVP